MKKRFIFKAVAVYLTIALFAIGMVPRVEAGFAPSQPTGSRAEDVAKIQKVLEMKVITENLEKMGYSKAEVEVRLAGMTDQQIHKMASQIDEVRAGGDGLGVVIGILVIIILVLVILQLTGHKVIIK